MACLAAASAMIALAGCGQGTAAGRPTVTAADFGGYPGRHAPELALSGLAAAHGELVAVGASAGHPAVWRRTPGGTWSPAFPVPARPGLAALASVAHGPDGWLAIGAGTPAILTSADSMSWRSASTVTRRLGGVSSAISAAGPTGYVIIGKRRKPGGACAADIWWSPDLAVWAHAHDVNDTTGSSDVLAVAAGPHGFVSVGLHNDKPAVWTTTSGRAWTTIVLRMPSGAPGAALQQVAINGSRVVALGEESTAKGKVAVRPFAEFSADDGASWRLVPLSFPGAGTTVTAVTAVSRGFVAAGRYAGPGQAGHRGVGIRRRDPLGAGTCTRPDRRPDRRPSWNHRLGHVRIHRGGHRSRTGPARPLPAGHRDPRHAPLPAITAERAGPPFPPAGGIPPCETERHRVTVLRCREARPS